ncbi:MAG: extracellular solute-binding protein [Clostridia bacterium]|nr:extracellular solute-binding protein [Clostridia bacterium]
MKKLLALVLTLVMLFSLSAAALAEDGIEGYETPITLKVGRNTTDVEFYGGEDWDNNSWTKLYADHGINVETLFAVDDSQFSTKLATSILSGNYPDIISCSLAEYTNYADGDVIADITDLIDQYASDELKEYIYGDGGSAMNCLKVNGRIYGLPKMSSAYGSIPVMFLRGDWLKNLGLEIPTTMEELKAVAHAFTYNDPDGNGANDTYGLALSGVSVLATNWGDTSEFFDAFNANIGTSGMGIVAGEDGKVTWGGTNTEGMKAALTLLHEMYEDGSLVKDFITMTGSNISEEAGSGRCGIFTAPMWGAMGPIFEVRKTQPEAEFIAIAMPDGIEGTESKMFLPVAFSGVYCISSECEHPEALIKLMNLSVHYLVHPADAEEYYRYYGDYEKNTGWKLALTDTLEAEKNYSCFLKMAPAIESRSTDGLTPYELDIYTSLIKYIDAVADGTYDPSDSAFQGPVGRYTVYGDPNCAYKAIDDMIKADRFTPSAFNAPLTEDQADMTATLKKMTIETIVKIITGSEPIDYYDTFLASWLANGGQDYINVAQEWYSAQQ